jgi:hypothetical protein
MTAVHAHEDQNRDKNPRREITIIIDGKPHTTRDDDQEALALLLRAGLDPSQYDLIKVGKKGQVERFKDGHVINLEDGDEFESVKHESQVA